MADLSFDNLKDHTTDEDQARELLEKQRWPNGPVCPHCGSTEAYRLKAKPESKRPVRKGVFKCKPCRRQFTVTVGTIFEGSHIPLTMWLRVITLLCSSEEGLNAHQLHRMLGITYRSAWFMAQRIGYGMTQGPLAAKLTKQQRITLALRGFEGRRLQHKGAPSRILVVKSGSKLNEQERQENHSTGEEGQG